jgi:hypothetical protein
LGSLRRIAPVLLILGGILLGATPVRGPQIGVTVQTLRTSFDLLDAVTIEVIAHNPSSALASVSFPAPTEYEIDVSHDGQPLWTSLPPSPPPSVIFAAHTRMFNAGPTPLVLYDWNCLTSERWSPLPGKYKIRVTLLDVARPTTSVDVTFLPPLPTTVLSKLKAGEAVTIGGRLDPTRQYLTDASGTITLTRRLLTAPAGFPIVLRGYPVDHPGGSRTFTFDRWAPLGGPVPTPAPVMVLPAPKPTTSARSR